MKRLFFIAVCVMGAGQVFAFTEILSMTHSPAPSPVLRTSSPQQGEGFIEIYAVSQEKPQALSAAGAKTDDSAETGIKDSSKKGLAAVLYTPASNPPQSPFFKGGGREEGRDCSAAVFIPLRL